jgi:hypothetical protein
MIYINQDKLNLQKKALNYLLKRMGANLLSGKSPLRVSMPVFIFERRSNLERFATSFACAPHYLEKAAASDPVQRLANVTAFLLNM